jgi:type I restriction enzyme S subunit
MSEKIMKNVPRLRFTEFMDKPGWEELPLSKLGKTVPGLTYSPNDVRQTGLLVLRSSNIKNGVIVLDDCVYVIPGIKGANLTQPNDILICVRNGSTSLIGKNALIPDGMPPCTHGAFMTVFRAKHASFVFQLLQTETYQRQVNADLGARINSINNGQFINYKFLVPSHSEQQKIADCLNAIDELITASVAKAKVLKKHKKAPSAETLEAFKHPKDAQLKRATSWLF